MLRQRVTTDIATKGGQFDILTIGTYEVPIWAKKGWLVPLDNLGADYDVDDLLPADPRRPVRRRQALCRAVLRRELHVMYRKDLFEKAGLNMPDKPDLGFHQAGRRQDHRPSRRQSTASACAARPAGARTWRS